MLEIKGLESNRLEERRVDELLLKAMKACKVRLEKSFNKKLVYIVSEETADDICYNI